MHQHECVTLYPSCWPASPVKSVSAARGQSQAVGPWPEHGTPHRGSRPAHIPPLDSGSNFYFLLTRDLQPGGRKKGTDYDSETLPVRGKNLQQLNFHIYHSNIRFSDESQFLFLFILKGNMTQANYKMDLQILTLK